MPLEINNIELLVCVNVMHYNWKREQRSIEIVLWDYLNIN